MQTLPYRCGLLNEHLSCRFKILWLIPRTHPHTCTGQEEFLLTCLALSTAMILMAYTYSNGITHSGNERFGECKAGTSGPNSPFLGLNSLLNSEQVPINQALHSRGSGSSHSVRGESVFLSQGLLVGIKDCSGDQHM